MRRLMLLRHAKTETDAPSGQDFDRRLDPRGREDAALIGQWLAQQERAPDVVLVSTAVRAQQTWDIVGAQLAKAGMTPKTFHLRDLYGAGPGQLLNALQVKGGVMTSAMIVAHNPGLHELGFALTASGNEAARSALADNLPTCAVATLDFTADSWTGVHFRSGDLIGFMSPKLLKD